MNWEERLAKAREKRKAALARKSGPKAPVVRGVDAAEMLRRADPTVLEPPPPEDDPAHPPVIDERTLRGQTPVRSPGLAAIEAGVRGPGDRSGPVPIPIPATGESGLVVDDEDLRGEAAGAAMAAPSAARNVAVRIGSGFGVGLGIGTSLVVAALIMTRDGSTGGFLARFAQPEPPTVGAVAPLPPTPAPQGASPVLPAVAGQGAGPGDAAGPRPLQTTQADPLPQLQIAGLPPQIDPGRAGGPAGAADAPDLLARSPGLGWRPDATGGDAAPVAMAMLGVPHVPVAAPVMPALARAPAVEAMPGIPLQSDLPAAALEAPWRPQAPDRGAERAPVVARAIAPAPLREGAFRLAGAVGADAMPATGPWAFVLPPDVDVALVSFQGPVADGRTAAPAARIGAPPSSVPAPGAVGATAIDPDPGFETTALLPPAAPPPAEADALVPGAAAVLVHLNAPETVPEGDLDSVTGGLAEAGVAIAKVNRVGFKVSETQIRYFHADNAETATALADLFGGRARDFTNFRPTPPEGTLEVYLAGDRVAPPPRPQATRRSAQPSELDRLRDRIVQRLRRGDHL